MKSQKKYKIGGERVIKTGLAVLITAWICTSLGLPAIFAVITAIVTLEPTASDSIRKGFVRLPASAIGAAISVGFVSIYGETAFTYAIAATLTIFICHKLKLTEGTLVATLTAVAMIPDIDGHFLMTFLARLGTTFIGLVVSTLVNLVVLPPKFTPLLAAKLDKLFHLSAHVLVETMETIFKIEGRVTPKPMDSYLLLRKEGEKAVRLSTFQREEWKFHRGKIKEFRLYSLNEKRLTMLQRIILHLGNLQYIDQNVRLTPEEKTLLISIMTTMKKILQDPYHEIDEEHYCAIEELDTRLKKHRLVEKNPEKYRHHFSPKTIVFYELLSLHDTLEELELLMSHSSNIRK
ncbi:FUSC family protein [Desertibacillus haloalkaliphilus]|uniref:FUSC family protein n=1 Tax=Desertibacillus haloalkaliphilus TaxID=1328930 RepID=UPI001C252836|nr:aromatic acid exporter family protein [Desertibacillus haloalkaliphilus]MBU8907335.1 FUSC family protein [Desertibacillus haloalkaliphilus]